MSRPPLLMILGFAPMLPLVAVALRPRRLRGVRAWVFAWAVVQGAGALLQFWLNLRDAHNLWVGYLVEPLSAAALLWALSLWQREPAARLTIRVVIPVVIATFVGLTFGLDSTATFSWAAQPALYLICLGATAFTLVQRSRIAAGDLLRQDWLWIGAGMVLYYGTGSALYPLSLLLVHDVNLFVLTYEFANAVAVVAFLAVARGLTCPVAT